jgi:hypothetical protein
VLVLAKDRYGAYRTGLKVAQSIVTPDPARVRVDLVALAGLTDSAAGSAQFRPTGVIERVSRYLETHPGSADRTGGRVRENVKGKTETVLEALSLLVAEGYVETSSGPRYATVFTVTKPFTDQ